MCIHDYGGVQGPRHISFNHVWYPNDLTRPYEMISKLYHTDEYDLVTMPSSYLNHQVR